MEGSTLISHALGGCWMHCTLDVGFYGTLIFWGTFPVRAKRLLLSAQKLLTAFERTGKAIEWEGKSSLGYSQQPRVGESSFSWKLCFFTLGTVNMGAHVTLGYALNATLVASKNIFCFGGILGGVRTNIPQRAPGRRGKYYRAKLTFPLFSCCCLFLFHLLPPWH